MIVTAGPADPFYAPAPYMPPRAEGAQLPRNA